MMPSARLGALEEVRCLAALQGMPVQEQRRKAWRRRGLSTIPGRVASALTANNAPPIGSTALLIKAIVGGSDCEAEQDLQRHERTRDARCLNRRCRRPKCTTGCDNRVARAMALGVLINLWRPDLHVLTRTLRSSDANGVAAVASTVICAASGIWPQAFCGCGGRSVECYRTVNQRCSIPRTPRAILRLHLSKANLPISWPRYRPARRFHGTNRFDVPILTG
ncbi:hypothetical protein K466DRAFT_589022 [Polyporus arcularius HHB13444]|uniref:Uncharacterized protein n=1 Tax=Polyporus arcularius HHB13444 TaxID=1314778 RepID=A0A5C3P5Q4_9APHY|nr:hypothetical protein K466DRAFT_589022 [Polyporus arcularius HHB13444]